MDRIERLEMSNFVGLPVVATALALAGVVGAAVTCPGSPQPLKAADFVAGINPGWNPGNTMDAMPTETSWGQPLLVNSTFTNVKAHGFRGIRLPVTYADHFTSDAPDYTIDPVWLQRVSDVVDMITSNGMYAMVNSHHDSWSWLDPTAAGANQTQMQAKFYAMWYQIGTKLACKPLTVGFEALNEPSGSSASDAAFLNSLQATFVKAINDAGGWNSQRIVILGGMGDGYTNMVSYWKPPPNITNPIVLTYHYYGPCMSSHLPAFLICLCVSPSLFPPASRRLYAHCPFRTDG
jgi:endoglucanase